MYMVKVIKPTYTMHAYNIIIIMHVSDIYIIVSCSDPILYTNGIGLGTLKRFLGLVRHHETVQKPILLVT